MNAKSWATIVGVVSVTVVTLLIVAGIHSTSNGGRATSEASSSTQEVSGIQGIVTGYVTVGPSQPSCPTGQACDVNMTGYALVFTPQCAATIGCQSSTAELSPGGHYSILLPAGNYSVTGLSPSCDWVGCSSAFPKSVVVEGGMQLVLNVEIDTGIR